MSSAHNAPYGLGCWHSVKGRSHWKSSLLFKDLGMTLQKCHLSLPSLSRITRKIPGNRLWNCRAQFPQAKAAQQHLPTGKEWEMRNWKLSMEPQNIPFHDPLCGYFSSTHFSGTLLDQVHHKHECTQAMVHESRHLFAIPKYLKHLETPHKLSLFLISDLISQNSLHANSSPVTPRRCNIGAILGPGPHFWAH